MKRYIGLRNMVTDKKVWRYLLFYEIDGHDENTLNDVLSIFTKFPISHIVYKSLNGYHFVGLTPLTASRWGQYFERLQHVVPEYYSGHTLRGSLKPGEKQELIGYSFRFPLMYNLAHLYAKRFNIGDIPEYPDMPKWYRIFETYWTTKQDEVKP